MSVIHILHTPMKVIATAEDFLQYRWCFNCRKRLPHHWEMLATVEPSYYEPNPALRCSGCGRDCTSFPGCDRDGPHYPEQPVAWRKVTR